MKTVRRLYFYAVALISLEVVLWGLIGLLRTMIDNISIGGGDALARALALVLVGVPIFLVHWLWAQRAAARDPEEKQASLRAAFLYGTLLATLVPAVQNLLALINRLFLGAAQLGRERALVGGYQTWGDNLIAIAMNLLVAAYFWNVLRGEWRTLADRENFSEVRRLYRYIWLLYSLLMTVFGAQQLLRFIFFVPTNMVGVVERALFVNGVALLIVGVPIWLYTWNICQEALSDPAERASVLRLGVLYLLALGGVIAVLAAAGTLIYQLLNQLLGANVAWPDFVRNIGGPVSVGVPLGAVWAYYGAWLNRHIEASAEGARREALKRPYQYILSLIGLAAAFIGVTLLLRAIIDLGLGLQFVGNDLLRERTAGSIAAVLVGLPLWLRTWQPAERLARAETESGELARGSVVRRGYLYLVLFVSVIGGMSAAVALVFRLLSALFTGDLGNFWSTVLNSLQLLLLFAVVLVYHLGALRRDGASRAEAEEPYPVLVIDPGSGDFAERARAALDKGGRLAVTAAPAAGPFAEAVGFRVVILPQSAAFQPSEGLRAWLEGFRGRRIIVPDEAGGPLLAADVHEAADLARRLAHGQEVTGARAGQPGWMIMVYVFAALFVLQLLLGVLAFGISSLFN